jgi:iron complex outermembrane receptor protein
MLRSIKPGGRSNSLGAFNVLARLKITPSETLSIDLSADAARLQSECCTQVPVRVGATLKPANRQFPALAAAAGYAPLPLDPKARITDIDAPLAIDTTEGGVLARIEARAGAFDLTSLTAWRMWDWDAANDRDYTGLSIQTVQHIPSRQTQASQEVRLATRGEGPVQGVAGIFIFTQTIRGRPISVYGPVATAWLLGPAPTYPAGLLDGYGTDGRTRFLSTSAAVFGEASWAASDRLSLTAGLRFTREDKTGRFDSTVSGGGPAPTAFLQSAKLSILRPQSYSAKVGDGALSGRLAAVYRLTPGLSAYASLARAEKSGGINMSGLPTDAQGQPALTTAVIRPERVTAWEAGLKLRPEGGRAAVSLDVFETRVGDYQANVVDSGPGALRGYLANIEAVRSRGVEVEVEVRPVEGLILAGQAALTDARYRSYANGPCPLERIGSGTTACDLSGQRLPGVPKWAWSATADYARPLAGAGLEAFVRADASGRSDSAGEATGSAYTVIDGSAFVNLSAGIRRPGAWEVTAWVRNAFDAAWLTAVTVQAGNSGLVLGAPGDPRLAGLTLRLAY